MKVSELTAFLGEIEPDLQVVYLDQGVAKAVYQVAQTKVTNPNGRDRVRVVCMNPCFRDLGEDCEKVRSEKR